MALSGGEATDGERGDTLNEERRKQPAVAAAAAVGAAVAFGNAPSVRQALLLA